MLYLRRPERLCVAGVSSCSAARACSGRSSSPPNRCRRPAPTAAELIYGAGIGLLVYVLRTWGGYPDGVAFSVLLMNGAVPLINRYTRPRIYGQR